MANIPGQILFQTNNDAWFTANAAVIFDDGEIIYHEDGRYKLADGVTALSALTFRGSGGSATWGGITGTLSSQTDLQTALDSKLNKSGSNADQNLDLGAFSLHAKSLKVNGTNGDGKVQLKHQSSNATANANETSLFAGSDGEPYYKNDGNAVAQIASRAWVNLQGFITNVVTALGYTPANKAGETFTGAISATNLSGTNTGDQDLSLYAKNDVFFSGQWTAPIGSGAYTVNANNNGFIFLMPLYVDRNTTFTDIGMEVETAAAASNIRLGMYDDDGTGLIPNTLLVDSGNLSAATTGLKSFTFGSPITLLASKKVYWLGFQTSSNTIRVRYNNIITRAISTTGPANGQKVIAQAFGAFPASGTSAVFTSSLSNFKVMLKVQ